MLALQPSYLEEILRSGGPTKLTPYTVTSPRLLQGRMQRAADTGIAHEWEETRLGWWCCATLVCAPTASYIFGLTAETNGNPMARDVIQLRQVAENFGRELTATAARAN
jgi:DNA-binding IclR family transcriptional regulator